MCYSYLIFIWSSFFVYRETDQRVTEGMASPSGSS